MKKNTLPIFGIGPIYVVSCLLLTAFGLFLKKKGFLNDGDLRGLKSVAMIIGFLLIKIFMPSLKMAEWRLLWR